MNNSRVVAHFCDFYKLLDIEDFDMLMVLSIGSRHHIHSDIKDIYRKNQEYYYELYKNSCFYKDERIEALSALNNKAIQEFSGIYLHEHKMGTNSILLMLIKKGYKFIYNFVKNRKIVDFYELRDAHLKYVSKNNQKYTVHSAHIFTITLYLCKELNKKIIYDEFDINLINESIYQIISRIKFVKYEENKDDPFLKQYKEIGLLKRGFNLPLNELITAFNSIHKKQYAKKQNLDMNDSHDHEKINDFVMDHEFMSGISKTALILRYCNIHPIDLQNVTNMTDQKIKELYALCLHFLDDEYTEEELYNLFGTYLMIYALAQDYNTTKYNYIVSSSDEMFLELEKLKNDYEDKIKSFQFNEEKQKRGFEQILTANSNMEQNLRELEKSIKKKDIELQELNKKIIKLEEQKKYLIQENEFYKTQIIKKEEELSINEIASYINGKKCVVIGGIQNWQENIRGILSNCKLISPDELNVDLEYLKHYDLIIFNETYNNHSMYNKVKHKADCYKIPIVYSGRHTNINRFLFHIYNQLNVNSTDLQ